jgi:uncharacterized membrane protein
VRASQTYLSLVLLVVGLALIADALLRGSAAASIVLIVPVLSGSSPEFVLGTLLTFLGLLALFLTAGTIELTGSASSAEGATSRSGGVVLVGPVPIFFGEWRQMGRHGLWGWVAAGAIATAVLVLVFVWFWIRG